MPPLVAPYVWIGCRILLCALYHLSSDVRAYHDSVRRMVAFGQLERLHYDMTAALLTNTV